MVRESLLVAKMTGHLDKLAAEPGSPLLPAPTRRNLLAQIRPGWRSGAACASADPEAWFPEKGTTPSRQVMAACVRCPVRRSCLATALVWNEEGIWAGTNPRDRREAYRLLRLGITPAEVLDVVLGLAARRSYRLERKLRTNQGRAGQTSRERAACARAAVVLQ